MGKNILEKTKESFITAAMAAILVLIVILLIWVPLKLIPKIYTDGSSYVASSLSQTFLPAENTGVIVATTTYATTSVTSNTNAIQNNPVRVSNYVGKPDLMIRLVGTGIIDRNTRQFIKTNTINSGDEAGIRFEVVNIGDSPSGTWSFNAILPSATTPSYNSNTQVSVNRGEGIQFTLGFDNFSANGVNNAYISVNSSGVESNSNNNDLTVPIVISGITNNTVTNYNNNGNYGVIDGNGYQYVYGNSQNTYVPGTTYTWTSLSGSCSVSSPTAYTGTSITWYANATGGNGYYTYLWSGTNDLNSNDKNPVKTYDMAGVKSATVTITSNGVSITKQCSVNIINQYNNYNNSDISVSLTSVGIISSNGQFYETNQIARGSTVAVKVNVTNLGTSYTGVWGLIASLSPSMTGYTYSISNQTSLAPGANTQVVITFYNPQITGTNNISVQVDQSNVTSDSNRSNNTLNSTVNIY